ncbi:MAG: lipopolysaccharide biosynthesis protein [Flavobacteriales bacterium]
MGAIAKQGTASIFFIFIGFFIGTISNLFFLPFWFSKDELGQVQYFISWGIVFSQFFTLGSGSLAVRYYAKWKSEGKEGVVLFICLIFPIIGSVIFSVFMALFGQWYVHNTTEKLLISVDDAVIITLLFTIILTFIKTYSGLAIALKQVWQYFFLNEVFVRFGTLAVFGLCFYHYLTYLQLIYAILLIYLLMLSLTVLFQGNKWINGMRVPDKAELKESVQYGMYAFFDTGATVLVNRLDILMVIALMGTQGNIQGQILAMALNIASIVMMPWRSMSTAASPYIAEAVNNNDYKVVETIYKKTSVNCLLAGGWLMVLILCGTTEIFTLIPDNYTAAIIPLIIICVARITDMLSSVNGLIIVLTKYFRWNLYFNLMVIVFSILANLVLIPLYGIIGVSVGTLLVVVFSNLLKGLYVYKKLAIHPFHKKTFYVLALLGVLLGIGLLMPVFTKAVLLNLIIKSAILTILFTLAMLFTHISEDMRKIGRSYLSRVGIRLKD